MRRADGRVMDGMNRQVHLVQHLGMKTTFSILTATRHMTCVSRFICSRASMRGGEWRCSELLGLAAEEAAANVDAPAVVPDE